MEKTMANTTYTYLFRVKNPRTGFSDIPVQAKNAGEARGIVESMYGKENVMGLQQMIENK
jgi:hypothetical protein